METRKVRTPSAKMIAAKQDEGFNFITPVVAKTTNEESSNLPTNSKKPEQPRVIAPPVIEETAKEEQITEAQEAVNSHLISQSVTEKPEEVVENIPVHVEVVECTEKFESDKVDPELDIESVKTEKDAIILTGSASDPYMPIDVAAEVTIEAVKYGGANRPQVRKRTNFTGETLNLRTSDLSIPNKAAHFLYFRCYDENEVQKEFPLTIDDSRKGPQNFLIEPRVGLRNTDYYIDSYLWNRGKSTSSKKKIYVEVDGNHVKTSRRSVESAPYLLNWYYSNMENRICKKVCWLETCPEGTRASPVLVQYHVNYLSPTPIELRKTPKLYSDTRSVAQELLRSDSPLQTVQRFVETGETDPREIINKKQAYEMRRYVMANARKKVVRLPKREMVDEHGNVFVEDSDIYEDVYYEDHPSSGAARHRENTEAARIAASAMRIVGRKLENRISALLDGRFGICSNKDLPIRIPMLNNPELQAQAELLGEWINSLQSSNAEDVDIVIHNVVNSMRKQLDELMASDNNGFEVDAGPSTSRARQVPKRTFHDIEEENHESTTAKQGRFEEGEGEEYYPIDHEYVEEEVIAEDMIEADVPSPASGRDNGNEHGVTRYFYGNQNVNVDN